MKFRKKPVDVEAEQFLATAESFSAIVNLGIHHSQWREGEIGGDYFFITTPSGEVKVSKGDWVIKGVNGEFYPCKPDIFEKTYDCIER